MLTLATSKLLNETARRVQPMCFVDNALTLSTLILPCPYGGHFMVSYTYSFSKPTFTGNTWKIDSDEIFCSNSNGRTIPSLNSKSQLEIFNPALLKGVGRKVVEHYRISSVICTLKD
ncbi:hypothetical protein TNIN_445681 [Trichonephila inaurata madagascariensis]|uniref:Uncharacterized protein n=1 Tax=Trichonephila inaurata madagascariensis TaxID=2747483 RepID=A0A8X7C3E2_9ARAC|nr:hypothetical protein TNIN_445681 [Trichonephila inaurata madagascariensis]